MINHLHLFKDPWVYSRYAQKATRPAFFTSGGDVPPIGDILPAGDIPPLGEVLTVWDSLPVMNFTIWSHFTSGGIFHLWGTFHYLGAFFQVLSISEMLAEKRTAPLNSSIEDGSKSLTMLGSILAIPWSCKNNSNNGGADWTFKVDNFYQETVKDPPI